MAKALKILLVVIIAIAALIFIAFKLFINEDQIKEQLQQISRQQTNGSLTISGPLGLSLFPRLGLSLGKLSYQLDGSDTPMAKLDQLQLGVGLWPLLSGQVEVDEVKLAGLKLQLFRDQQGLGNWERVIKVKDEVETVAPAPAVEGTTPPLALSVAVLAITDAAIAFEDRAAGNSYSLENVSASGRDINIDGNSFPLQLAFQLALSEPELKTTVKLTTQAKLNLKQERYQFESLQLNLSAQGAPTNGKELQADINMTADINLANETARLSEVKLLLEGVMLEATIDAANWSTELKLDAPISIANFNPAKLLPKLGIDAPVFQNPASFTALSLSTSLQYQGNQAQLDNIDIKLDKTHIQGNLAVLDIDKQTIKTTLAIDTLNLDDYLPPTPAPAAGDKTKSPSPSAPTPAPATEEELLPVETLKSLDYVAKFSLGTLQANELVFTDVDIKTTANTGLVKLNNFYAKLYGGEIKAVAQLNVRPKIPRLSFEQNLSGVNLQPVLKALAEIDTVSGLANFDSKLITKGNSMDSWLRHLNGPANFSFKQVLIKELNLEHMACQGIALVHGKSMPAATENVTAIEAVTGKLQFQKGVLLAQSINGDMKTLKLKGNGKIYPLTEKLDIELGLRIAGDLVNKDSACRANSKYRDIYWPIQCKGSFADEPAKLCGLDKDELAKISADVAKDEVKEKAKDKAQDYLKKLLN